MYKALIFSVSTLAIASVCYASEMTWGFKSPAFHFGNGYSTHVLSAEQLKFNRQEDIRQEATAEQERIERELENSVLNKFVRNLESRIYATLSKQIADNMFGEGATIEDGTWYESETPFGDVVKWMRGLDNRIYVVITDSNGDIVAEFDVPVGEFAF